jgi:hypothetical protein
MRQAGGVNSPGAMSDEQLRNARDAWERERPARWAQVAAVSGTAYEAAFAEYMVDKAQADAVATEMRRRGVGRRHAGATHARPPRPPSPFRLEMRASEQLVEAVAAGAVRFPETERADLRTALKQAVGALSIRKGQLLRGTFAGPLPPHAKPDVENRVLLNIQLAQSCVRHGFAFEHDLHAPPSWACSYRYCAVDTDAPFEFWQPGELLARWNDLALEHGLTAPAIWWSARLARTVTAGAPHVRPIMVRATVATPRPLSVQQIKAVTDGLVAAAQWTSSPNPEGVERLTNNLALAGIDTDVSRTVALLRDATGTGVGHCRTLIAKDGRVDPDDHLVVAGIVIAAHGRSEAPRLSAEIHAATLVPTTAR